VNSLIESNKRTNKHISKGYYMLGSKQLDSSCSSSIISIGLGIITLLARFARFVRNCHALGILLRDHQKVDDFDDDIHNNNDDLKYSEEIEL
jgi:hypothetical protein